MLTAVDTNIISALWSKEPVAAGMAALLGQCRGEGGLVIAAPVYAELLAYPGADRVFLDGFLRDTDIQVHFALGEMVWHTAGAAFAEYAGRRRKAKDGQPKRLLVNFLIGAHARLQTDRLLTLDRGRYDTAFPDLTLLP